MKKLSILILAAFTLAIAQGQKLSLEDCIKIAIEKNPDMRIANKQLKDAKSGIKSSYSSILPSISISTSASKITRGPTDISMATPDGRIIDTTSTVTSFSDYGAGISYRQNLFDGGKWWNTISMAKSAYKGATQDRDYSRQLIIMNVAEKFYEVLKAQELLKVYKLSLESSREQVKKTEQLLNIGQVTKKDLLKAQVREGNDRLYVIQQIAKLKSSISALNLAMGRSTEETLEIYEEKYHKPEEIPLKVAFQSGIENNRELQSLHTQKQTSFLNYKITKGSLYPSISGSFSYSRAGGEEFSRIYSEFNKWWGTSFRLSLSYPIFDGFYRSSRIQQSWLAYKIYDDWIEKKKMGIKNQIQDLVLALDTYSDMIDINELNIQSAEEDLRLVKEMYRLNSATMLEVLDAQVELTRARWNLITTKYDAKIAEVQLALVMGNL